MKDDLRKKLAAFLEDPEAVKYLTTLESNDKLSQIADILENLTKQKEKNGIDAIIDERVEAGVDEYLEEKYPEILKEVTPIVGEDYFTEKDIQSFLKIATPVKGEDYFTKSEINQIISEIAILAKPISGKDYFTEKEIKEFLKRVTPKKGVDYFDGAPGVSLPGEPGKDGSPDTAEQIIKKINTQKNSIEVFTIKGLEELIKKNTQTSKSIKMHGGGSSTLAQLLDVNLGTLSNNDVLKYNSTTGKWENGVGGGGASPLTTKGDIYTYTTVDARLGVGANGEVLTADSTAPTGLKWAAVTGTGTVTDVSSANADISVATGTTTPVLTLNSATAATASTIVKRDASANIFVNNYFANTASTVSAGGTTVLTVASARTQNLTGSSNQTFQLPDATTLSLSSIFEFNNNSSGSLIITNAGAATQYTVPAGGAVYCYCTSISTANGTWDFHALAPLAVTWSSGVTGLVMNSVLTTSPRIGSGASSSTAPSFIPQRGASTTGFGGDGTDLFATIAGTAALTVSAAKTTVPGLLITGATATTVPYFDASKNLISSAVTPTELGYLSGVTSAIQTQLNAKGTGTVTSVAMTVPTGLTITGSPVTTTGTLAVALDTGYEIPLTATIAGKADKSGALTQFVGNGNWKVWYSDGSGDVTELALGASGTYLKSNGAAAAPTFDTPAGSGTVTNTGGNLTANSVVLGAGTVDVKVVAGITTDGTSKLNLGVAGASTGKIDLSGSTSGTITIQPAAAAGTYTLTLPTTDGNANEFLQTNGSGVLTWAAGGAGLVYWTEAQSTSAPNATVYVSSLTATGGATDIDATISPKGAGAILAQVPDSTATGGNKRGASAIDFQKTRANANEVASGAVSMVLGGQNNKATDYISVVVGGYGNANAGSQAFIGAGQANVISAAGQYGFIGAGYNNDVTGATGAAVVAGDSNLASGTSSFVGAGTANTASGTYAAIAAGNTNTASGTYSVATGGQNNTASGQWATVGGGYGNTANANGTVIAGGYNNSVRTSTYSGVGGGESNNGGNTGQTDNYVGGGLSNSIDAYYGFIGGGQSNSISASNQATISGGYSNAVSATSGTIGGGYDNTVSAEAATVSGGHTNTASGSYAAVTGGYRGEAHLYGERSWASGYFAAVGDAQAPDLLWRRSITGTSATELFLDGASVQAILKSGNTVWTANIKVVATISSLGNGGGAVGNSFVGEYLVGIKRLGSTTTLVGTVQTIATTADTNMTSSVVTITADDTTEALKITFTPDGATAGTTTVTRVVARGTIAEVRY